MTEFWATLPRLHEEIWTRLQNGVTDREAAARHPVLATVRRDGGAAARILVLRGADRAAATLTLQTDTLSHKVRELHGDPLAELLVWDACAHLQIRLRATIGIETGPALSAIWADMPDTARSLYGGTPAPGTPIDSPDRHSVTPDPARFARLTARISSIDALHLGADRHRRALFRRADGWNGNWRAP